MTQNTQSCRAQKVWRLPVIVACLAVLCGRAHAESHKHAEMVVATSDVRVEIVADDHAPRLISLAGPGAQVRRDGSSDRLPANIEAEGAEVPVLWNLKPELSRSDQHHAELVYESAQPHLQLRWHWEARAGAGPLEHRISVENLSGKEIWLPLMDSLVMHWQSETHTALRHFYVEKGAGTPSAEGTHAASIDDGYHWTGTSSTYAHPGPGEPREVIPFEIVYDTNAAQSGWYAGIEFSGRTRLTLERSGNRVESSLGLNPDPGPYRTRLLPGEIFTTPTVFVGAFSGGPDGAGNQLRPWVRAVLNNPRTWQDPLYPLMVNNSWGSGMQVDEPLALRMIADSKELGLEMFHLDAGWFRGVGDWYPDSKKFPHGLTAIADEAHRQGLRFGIWVDWTQAGLDTQPGALNVHDPKTRDWLVADVAQDWKPEEFKGQTIDLGLPAAREYAAHEVKRIVEDYHLDMLEHDGYLVAQGCTRDDHPHAPPNRSTMHVTHDWGSDFVSASNSTDVSYHATRAYYGIYDQLRREHPGLLLEICNDGGRMVDFGSASHGDYFSITDTYDPLSNRRAFYDASYLFPSPMLESYVEKWPTPRIENLLYMLRSGMMGWVTIMLDTTVWSPAQHDAARHAFDLYRRELRPLIREAQLYHVSDRPDGVRWDGMEYWDPARRKGVVFAFRGTTENEAHHRFVLAGLDARKHYRLHFEDKTAPDTDITGKELMTKGLAVDLPQPLSSELVFLDETTTGR